jgi:hypothetical protein
MLELQYEYIEPQSKAKVGSIEKMRMTARQGRQQSVSRTSEIDVGQEGRKQDEQPVHASDENTLLSFRNRMLSMYHPPGGGFA